MGLSLTAKEAIKTALAITMAYGIAMALGWDKPDWAAFSVAFISLATRGQSINKGAMRMLGTLMAGVASLIIIALSSQDRWLFMVLLSVWVGFCTYMMGGSKHPFFWSYSGYVCAVVSMSAGPDAVNVFNTVVLRSQETGLGILIYTVVAILIWPTNSRPAFEAAASKIASTQNQLLKTYLVLMAGKGDPAKPQQLRAQEIEEQNRFNQLLEAAETDSYDIWELRQQWRLYQRQVKQLSEAMERLRESFFGEKSLDLPALIPNLKIFGAELEGRLTQIGRMLTNQEPELHPSAIDLKMEETEIRHLSHFQKAALAVIRAQLRDLESLTRSMFDSVCYVKGFCGEAPKLDDPPPVTAGFGVPDPDQFSGVVRVMVIMWLAYFALIYVEGLPGGTGVVILGGTFGMVMAGIPQVSIWLLFLPAFLSTLLAGLVYIFVMPQLSSFWGLGTLIFVITFGIYYLLAAPRLNVAKLLAIAMFITVMSISNQQSYSFLVVSITALMLPVVWLLIAVTAYFPYDLRPRQSFLRLLGRYFNSCEFLMGTVASQDPLKKETGFARWRKTFHLHEVSSLPTKLGTWSRALDTKILPGTSPQQISAVITALQGLSLRMQQLIEERGNSHSPFLVQELQSDVAILRRKITEAFRCLTEEPSVENQNMLYTELADIKDHLNIRIKETVDKETGNLINEQDGENFYRLVGAYRGVSDALAVYVGNAGAIDWTQWRTEKFF